MQKSEDIQELAKALTKAQQELITVSTDSKNPFFKSSYASLPAILKAVRKPLADNGLSFVQSSDAIEGKCFIETVLMHESGQWISGSYPVNPTKNDPQGLGSATSYARRYSLTAMLGIAQDDDDGQAASRPVQTNVSRDTNPDDYVFPFGKYKGKKLGQIDTVELRGYRSYLKSQVKEKGSSNAQLDAVLKILEKVK